MRKSSHDRQIADKQQPNYSHAICLISLDFACPLDVSRFAQIYTIHQIFIATHCCATLLEVLFVPGITIPSMVQLVEAHGLQPVGVDPLSPQKMLPATLEQLVTPKTKMVSCQIFAKSLPIAKTGSLAQFVILFGFPVKNLLIRHDYTFCLQIAHMQSIRVLPQAVSLWIGTAFSLRYCDT